MVQSSPVLVLAWLWSKGLVERDPSYVKAAASLDHDRPANSRGSGPKSAVWGWGKGPRAREALPCA